MLEHEIVEVERKPSGRVERMQRRYADVLVTLGQATYVNAVTASAPSSDPPETEPSTGRDPETEPDPKKSGEPKTRKRRRADGDEGKAPPRRYRRRDMQAED